MSAAESKDVAGLVQVKNEAMRRVPLRLRGGNVTMAGWRLEVSCQQGHGAITQAEGAGSGTWLRGEGLLLGLPQDRLHLLWAALTTSEAGSGDSGPQLG